MAAMLRKKRSGETEQEGHRHTRTERKWRKRTTTSALLDAAVRRGGAYKCLLSPSPLGMCAFLSGRDWKWQKKEAAFQMPGLLWAACCVYNLIWWKGETFGALELQTGRQWAKESMCPLGERQRSLHPLSSIHTDSSKPFPPRLDPPPWSPPGFQHADGFKMGLHSPGHLGWWSPPPQGPGRSLELRLEGNTHKNCNSRGDFFFFFFYIWGT